MATTKACLVAGLTIFVVLGQDNAWSQREAPKTVQEMLTDLQTKRSTRVDTTVPAPNQPSIPVDSGSGGSQRVLRNLKEQEDFTSFRRDIRDLRDQLK